MIHLCACTGGLTSNINSRKRRGGTTTSCKNCGGRPAIHGQSSSNCLLSTVFTTLINSDFTWTKVSKGCRSSSRRPRRPNSNAVNLACGELLTNNTADLEMSVSESEKLGILVLGCHFSEKAEHIPIKKRRFLVRASSPPCNTTNLPLEGLERQETSSKSNSNAISLPVTYEAVTRICKRGGKDHKRGKTELVKDDDFSGISILAAAACSSSLGAEADQCVRSGIVSSVTKAPEGSKLVDFNENNVKKEPESHTSTTPKDGESTSNNSSSHIPLELASSKTNQEPTIQKSPARDVRFSWDLNTVMDAWEDSFVSEHAISNDEATCVEKKKDDNTEFNPESPSKSIINQNLSVEFNSLAHENKELNMEKCEQLSHEFDQPQHAALVKMEYLHNNHTDSASDAIPVTRTLSLENPAHGIFSKSVNLCGQSSGCFGSTEAVDTKLSIDCSIPPGFDQCLYSRASKENVGPPTQTIMTRHDVALKTATYVENGPNQSGVTSNKVEDEAITKMELTSYVVAMEDLVNKEETNKVGFRVVREDQPAAVSSVHDADNGFGYSSQAEKRAGNEIAKVGQNLNGYDSQYEDGELRALTRNDGKGYELPEGENEYDMNRENGLDMDILDAREINSQNGQEGFSGTIELTEVGSGNEADLISSVVLPGKLQSSDEVLSCSEPNEMTSGQVRSERQDSVKQHASQSDECKMNMPGWDLLPESRINSNGFDKTRNFTGLKLSCKEEQKDRFDTEDMEMKAEGSRFHRKESLTRSRGPSACDVFLSRDRFQMQGCSSKEGDSLTSRPDRESGAFRSFGKRRYLPHSHPSNSQGGMWNRSLERGRDLRRLPSPSYQGNASFHPSILEDSGTIDNMKNEGGMDPTDVGRHKIPSYVSHRPSMDWEVNDFRERLGLRPTRDMCHDRFVNLSRGRGWGRSMKYGTQIDGEGSRGRYHGHASDKYDDLMTDYSHHFPRRRGCFSPIEGRGNNSYQHHQCNSRSPSRHRTRSPNGNNSFTRRSRSPGYRPDARTRRPRSPSYWDHPSEYKLGPRKNDPSPPNSRWVNYKERVFNKRSPPRRRTNGPQRERFSFYDSSQKPRQNDYYKSGHPVTGLNEGGRGRPRHVDNDRDRLDNGYRREGFASRYNTDEPTKHFQYEDENRYSRSHGHGRHALEVHAPSNLKPCSDVTDTRQQRGDGREFRRRSRERRDRKEKSDHMADDFKRKLEK